MKTVLLKLNSYVAVKKISKRESWIEIEDRLETDTIKSVIQKELIKNELESKTVCKIVYSLKSDKLRANDQGDIMLNISENILKVNEKIRLEKNKNSQGDSYEK